MKKIEISIIETADTYHIRSAELRQGLPLETCKFEGDNELYTFHLGCFVDNELASIGSFYLFNTNKILLPVSQYQLRGMATLEKFRGKGLGLGRNIIATAREYLSERDCHLLWCNARESAIVFYEKVDFQKNSEMFDIPDVGPHVIMSCPV